MTRGPRTRPVRGPGGLPGLVPTLPTGLSPSCDTTTLVCAANARQGWSHRNSTTIIGVFQRHHTNKRNIKTQGFIACSAHHVFVRAFPVCRFVQGSAWVVSVTLTNRCSSKQAAWVSMNPRIRTPNHAHSISDEHVQGCHLE